MGFRGYVVVGAMIAGVAAVVDPRLEVEEYLALARYMGVHIAHVLETHTHADHVSGHGRLAAATGAVIHVHRDAGAEYDHEPIDVGWALDLGAVRVVALHTPGHRPEHTAFALVDTSRGPEPWAILTGDSLFSQEFYAMLADNWNFSGAKAREELGWQPRTFQEGMSQLWAEWQAPKGHPAAAPERPPLERALRRA